MKSLDASVIALVLAAGSSRRFGSDKRRVRLGSDKTLLEQSLVAFSDADIPIYLCLSSSAEDDDIDRRLESHCRGVIRCDQSKFGMGATLAQGIKKIPGSFSPLIALGDMPFLLSATIRQLLAENRNDHIVFPTYRGKRGHPVLFGARFKTELAALSGDAGAASILKKHADSCVAIPVDDPGILADIDTPESLARAFPAARND